MRIGRRAVLIAATAALGQAGCASMRLARSVEPNPLVAPSADFERAWKASVAALDEYFTIASENRLKRQIITQPKAGATLLEPWVGDSVGFDQRLESSLQTIRRYAIVTVNPAPGGGQVIKVEVFKQIEDLIKPDRQAAGRTVFNNDFPVNRSREVVGSLPLPVGWIDRGRDPKLEQAILAKIRESLFL